MTPNIPLNDTQAERVEQLSLVYDGDTYSKVSGKWEWFLLKSEVLVVKTLSGCAMTHGQLWNGPVGTEVVVAPPHWHKGTMYSLQLYD